MRFACVTLAYRWFILVLCALGACTSLPALEPYGDAPVAVVRLAGARGALSPQQSQKLLAQLGKRSGNTGLLEHHLAREEAIVGSPLTTGNSVKLLQDGPATYRAMFEAIAAAKDHINLETYILEDDDVGQQFAQVLIDKQQRGIQVNIIHDSVGSFGTSPHFQEVARQRHSCAGIQSGQPVDSRQGVGTEPARPSQVAHRRRQHRVSGRHQHQQCVLGRFLQETITAHQDPWRTGLA
jgi:phosphatidylserine/phosphatidylglycerophosphate/cardiolipin synthase-like enzyme